MNLDLGTVSAQRGALYMRQFLAIVLLVVFAWNEAGSQQFWRQTSPTANCTALAADERHAFVGTHGGGLFRFTSSTKYFESLLSTLPDSDITALAVTNHGIVYAGGSGRRILVSSDDGATWEQKGPEGLVISSIAVSTTGLVLVSTPDRIYRSTDEGVTWTYATMPSSGFGKWALAFDSSGVAYAGGFGRGVFHSLDTGRTWIKGNEGLVDTVIRALAADRIGNVFAGTYDHGVYRSTDHGITWAGMNAGLPDTLVLSLTVDDSGRILAGTSTGIFRVDQEQGTWVEFDTGLPVPVSIIALAHSSEGEFFALTSQSLCRYTELDNSWSITRSFVYSVVLSLAMDRKGLLYAGTDGGGFFRSTDLGSTWSQRTLGMGSLDVWSVAADTSDHLYAATIDKGIFRSTDGGDHWIASDSGLTNPAVSTVMIHHNGNLFAGTYGGVFISTDHGVSWSPRNTGLTNLSVISLATNRKGDLIGGIEGGGIYVSTDLGGKWVPANLGDETPQTIVCDSLGVLYAGTRMNGICRSTDDGTTWEGVGIGLTDNNVHSLAIDQQGNLFAGTHLEGAFRSSDHGEHWTTMNAGLEEYGYTALGVLTLLVDSSGHLYAGTYDGVFRSYDSTTGVVVRRENAPLVFRLEQNYPNPFNPTTIISGQLAADSRQPTADRRIRLVVYDVLGREVAVLADGRIPAGKFSYIFDGTHCATGVYFYRLTAGNFTAVRKMTLVK